MTPSNGTVGTDVVERIRTELFANLAHYRQRCINERADAEMVAEFIEKEIRAALEAINLPALLDTIEKQREALKRVRYIISGSVTLSERTRAIAEIDAALRVRAALANLHPITSERNDTLSHTKGEEA